MSDAHRVNTTYNTIKNKIAPIETEDEGSSSESEDSTEKQQLHKTYEKFKADTNYLQDLKDAFKIWTHEPLLKAYFSRGFKDDYDKYELQDMERLRNRKARLITSKSYLMKNTMEIKKKLSKTQIEQ